MIQLVLTIVASYLGYRRWGGWQGALRGVLILWVIYVVFILVPIVSMVFLGGQVESILSEVGTPP